MPKEPVPYTDVGGGGALPPHGEDYFDRIVNVHWRRKVSAEGLAVQFSGDGNLSFPGDLDLTKAIISFWFWVPSSVTDAAFEEWKQVNSSDDPNVDLTLAGVVPLLTWGQGSTSWMNYREFSFSNPISPCFIGVQTGHNGFSPDEDYKDPKIAIRFQSQNASSQTQQIADDERRNGAGNFFAMGDQAMVYLYTSPGSGEYAMKVNEDAWNHIVVSFDVPGPEGKLWVTLNGEDYSGESFFPAGKINMTGFGYSGGPNDIVATFDFPFYHDGSFEDETTDSGGFSMPSDSFGTPFYSTFSPNGKEPVIMAELQVFTGIALDTRDVVHVFLDGSKPVDPKVAEENFGKKPDILLHGTSRWIEGVNTGTSNDFSVTETIRGFVPDPSL